MNSQGLAAMGTILLSGAPGGKFAGEQNCDKTVALGGGGFKYFQCSTLYGIFTYMYLVDFYGFHIPVTWILWTSFLNWTCQGIQDTEVAFSCFVKNIISCEFGPPKILFGQIIATSQGPPRR